MNFEKLYVLLNIDKLFMTYYIFLKKIKLLFLNYVFKGIDN